MEWQVKYEAKNTAEPWCVYKVVAGQDFFAEKFATEGEAKDWVKKKDRKDDKAREQLGTVNEASAESFPASDPPAWTNASAATE